MTDKETKKLVSDYIDSERILLNHIHNLENGDTECNCADREIIKIVHEGEFAEIITYCVNCGGNVE